MDSLTQFALGAVIGQLAAGRQYGIKAGLVGGLVATLPDLDVFVGPLLYESDLDVTIFHRSHSHSIFWQSCASILIAGVCRWCMPRLSYAKWLLVVWLCLMTHTLIDLGTSYGLPLWLPFSSQGYSTHHISIVDPLFTVPLVIAMIGSWIWIRRERGRRVLVIGTSIAVAYFALTIGTKYYVHHSMRDTLPETATSYLETPEFANIILRKIIAQDSKNFYLTRYNILTDDPQRLKRFAIPKNYPAHPTDEVLTLYRRWPLTVAQQQTGQTLLQTLSLNPLGVEAGATSTTILFGRVWNHETGELEQYRGDGNTSGLAHIRQRLFRSQQEFLDEYVSGGEEREGE